MNFGLRFFVSAWVALIAVSCSSGSEDKSDTTAFTNRPQNYTHFIAIIKLSEPALLTSVQRVDGKPVIGEEEKAAVLAEQEAYVAKLATISPEIRVINRYRLVLNGLAVVAPKEVEEEIRSLAGTSYVEGEQPFQRLETLVTPRNDADVSGDLASKNSVAFIGAHKVHGDLAAAGGGVSVGIIDTGIDYTHAMFGGTGTEEAFTSNDPAVVEEGSFPTAKVVGGIDLVGKEYNSGAPDFARHIPIPDQDPIDEGGHGTHVAGTVAGIGDNINTYSGVAPAASLHAIKVFGADGSTGDSVIIAALEYAADPNGDMDPVDQLDVVNLSLGSSFGTPHILYSEAMKNLVNGGTMAIASGGNSGHFNYIVGAPGTTSEAISVAASIDYMDHNWKFPAVKFIKADGDPLISKAVEAVFAKQISEAGDVQGKLVFIGLADQALEPDVAAAVAGNVALIDRGGVTFCEKALVAADAGAIGFVVATNNDGEPIAMGGDCEVQVPGIMISKALGDLLKESMAQGETKIQFQTPERMEEPELIDTLTSFSSRGPRSIDSAIKPEVSAPGSQIISAKMGAGDGGVRMSGTSMAAPHVAGMAALLKQLHSDKTNAEIKSLLVNSTVSIDDAEGNVYPVAQQGAGRVQTYEAATAALVVMPSTLSLGEVLVEEQKLLRKQLVVKNVSAEDLVISTEVNTDSGLTITLDSELTLAPGESKTLSLNVHLQPTFTEDAAVELDGFLFLRSGEHSVARIPVLAVATKAARIKAKDLRIFSTSSADAAGAAAQFTLSNEGRTSGAALPFNLIAHDERNVTAVVNEHRNGICDMQSSGYRVIRKTVDGQQVEQLQIAVKLYHPVTTWNVCEVSVQIDGNGDGVADQELLGTSVANYFAGQPENRFGSLLMNGDSMRTIRQNFEANYPEVTSADYSPATLALEEAQTFDHSTLAVITADLSQVSKTSAGQLNVKIAVIGDVSSPSSDDFLAAHENTWYLLPITDDAIAYVDLPETITLPAGEESVVELTKGGAGGRLIVYLPHNKSNFSSIVSDEQAAVVRPRYGF